MHRYSVLLKCASRLVPPERRSDWLAEWNAELWYCLQQPDSRAFAFCLGAWPDALWLRRNSREPHARPWLQSPLACLSFLAAATIASAAIFYRLLRHLPDSYVGKHPPHVYQFLTAYLIMNAAALVVMYATSSFTLGEYPASPTSPAHARRFHRWAFLIIKFALLIPLVFLVTFDVAIPLSRHPVLQPQATMVGYVIAFRWALNDQRRRCPVCLRPLKKSASIGQFSHNFLEWYGTEFYCAKGHGLLHVPQIATTYDTHRWQDLDRSWSILFS
jgi:hypothetical protein